MGVARWYKFPERMKEANYMGRATWYRRRGTPPTILHLDMPLEQPGVARHCHSERSIGVCHLSLWRGTPNRGTTHSQKGRVKN